MCPNLTLRTGNSSESFGSSEISSISVKPKAILVIQVLTRYVTPVT